MNHRIENRYGIPVERGEWDFPSVVYIDMFTPVLKKAKVGLNERIGKILVKFMSAPNRYIEFANDFWIDKSAVLSHWLTREKKNAHNRHLKKRIEEAQLKTVKKSRILTRRTLPVVLQRDVNTSCARWTYF